MFWNRLLKILIRLIVSFKQFRSRCVVWSMTTGVDHHQPSVVCKVKFLSTCYTWTWWWTDNDDDKILVSFRLLITSVTPTDQLVDQLSHQRLDIIIKDQLCQLGFPISQICGSDEGVSQSNLSNQLKSQTQECTFDHHGNQSISALNQTTNQSISSSLDLLTAS